MRMYQASLEDGRVFAVVAYSRADVTGLLEQEPGINRQDVSRITRLSNTEYNDAKEQMVLCVG
jgi:hypothetical protein